MELIENICESRKFGVTLTNGYMGLGENNFFWESQWMKWRQGKVNFFKRSNPKKDDNSLAEIWLLKFENIWQCEKGLVGRLDLWKLNSGSYVGSGIWNLKTWICKWIEIKKSKKICYWSITTMQQMYNLD